MTNFFTNHRSKASDLKPRRAFTLLELVVALVILVILSALAIPTFAQVITNSKTATTEASVKAVYDDAAALCVNQPLSAMGGCLATAASETTAATGQAPGQLDAAAAWTVAAENTPVTTPGVIGWTVSGSNLGLAALTSDGTAAVYIDAPNTTTWSCANTTGDPAVAIAGVNSCTTTPDTTTTTVADTTTTTVPDTTTTTVPCSGICINTVASYLDTAPVPGSFQAGAISPDGTTLYVASGVDNEVYAKNIATGAYTVVAGNGTAGDTGDGGPATSAELNSPQRVVVSPSGEVLFIADTGGYVRSVDLGTGLITTVAGNGTFSYSGTTGTATSMYVGSNDIALSPDGTTLYTVNTGDATVYATDLGTNTATLVAGHLFGNGADSGDGGSAIAATYNSSRSVAVSPDGSTLYIGEVGSVRAVDLGTGIVTTVAGTGTSGFSGDGGSALAAQFGEIDGLVVSPDNATVYVSDYTNNEVRAVVPGSDSVTALVGTGTFGNGGDNGLANAAQLGNPQSVGLSPDGHTMYISEPNAQNVRVVTGL